CRSGDPRGGKPGTPSRRDSRASLMPIGPGVCQASTCLTLARAPWEKLRGWIVIEMSAPLRIMLGFVVRRCAVALGHPPTPAALAAAGTARRLFADLDGTLAARIARGDVLVAGVNLGRGAGGPAAAGALAAAGMIAVVARTFAAGFADALLAAGLPPLEVDAPAMFHTGQRLRVNLEAGVIANLSSEIGRAHV